MRALTKTKKTNNTTTTTTPTQTQTNEPNKPNSQQNNNRITYYDCSYTSLPQCNMSASGRSAQCVINPYYAYASEQPSGRRYKRYRGSY